MGQTNRNSKTGCATQIDSKKAKYPQTLQLKVHYETSVPTVRDRVVQMAAKLVIEPIFEADFQPCSYGFRPKKSATQALEAIREAGNRGLNFVVDADIQGYFDSIQREDLMDLLKERISDRRVLKLIRQWLEAGVMEDGTVRETLAGTPQGGVITPRTQKITSLLGGSGRIRTCRLRPIGNGAGLRNWDRVTDGKAVCGDKNFLHEQPQDLLALAYV